MACAVSQKCSPRLKSLLRLYILPLPLPFAAAAVIFFRYISIPAAMLFAVAAAICVWATVRLPSIYYDRLLYTRYRDYMKIERGVLWRKIILVPRRRVQYITMRRTVAEKLFGLCTLVFTTSGGRVCLPGLTLEDASRMREMLGRTGGSDI